MIISLSYTIFILFIITCIGCLCKLNLNSKLVVLFVSLIALWMIYIVVNRPSTLRDINNYITAINEPAYLLRFEPTFRGIVLFANIFFSDPVFIVFLIYAILAIPSKVFIITKYSYNIWLGLMMFISNFFIVQELIQIRAAVASSFFFLTLPYILKGDKLKTLIGLMIAVSFHYSACIYFIVFLINPSKKTPFLYLSLLAIAYFMHICGISIVGILRVLAIDRFSDTLYGYERYGTTLNVFSFLQIVRVLFCIWIWMNLRSIIKNNTNFFILILKLYTISLIIVPLLADIPPLAVRFSELFLVTEVFLVPYGLYYILKNKVAANSLTFLYALANLIYSINVYM